MRREARRLPTDALSVVVPTYNEAPNLRELLTRIRAAIGGEFLYEVVIADDRSPDGTARSAEELAAELSIPLRAVMREGPRSLSLAVIDGAKAARYACVVVMDADLSHDPAEISGLAREVLAEHADVAVASRYAPGGEIGSWPRWRRFLSQLGTRLARSLVRAGDPLSGYFACRRELLTGTVELRPRGYKILLELLARAPDLRVVERPIRFADRRRGKSKLRWRQKLQFLRQVVSLVALRLSRLLPSHSNVTRPRRALS